MRYGGLLAALVVVGTACGNLSSLTAGGPDASEASVTDGAGTRDTSGVGAHDGGAEDAADAATARDTGAEDAQDVTSPADTDTPGADAADTATPGADAADTAAPGADAALPPVALSFVQGNAVTSNILTGSVTLANPVAQHDAVIVAIAFSYSATNQIASVSDTLGNAYTAVALYKDIYWLEIAFATDSPAGPDTIHVTLTQPPGSVFVIAADEYAGIAQSGAFDFAGYGSGVNQAVDGMATTATTTSSPNELVFGFALGAASPGTGFTARAASSAYLTEDELAPTVESVRATSTWNGTGGEWMIAIATFRGQ